MYLTLILSLVTVLLIAIPVAILFEKRLWKTKYYVFTPENVVIKTSVFGEKQNSYSLKGITSINLQQTMLMKILDYGNITINFLGGSFVVIQNIPNPSKHMDCVHQIINKGYIEESTE